MLGVELDVTVSVGIMDGTRVMITIRVRPKGLRLVLYHLFYIAFKFWCAVTEFVPLNQLRQFLFNRRGFFTLPTNFVFMWSRFHWQWQQCK